jgi:hypothetical protein
MLHHNQADYSQHSYIKDIIIPVKAKGAPVIISIMDGLTGFMPRKPFFVSRVRRHVSKKNN